MSLGDHDPLNYCRIEANGGDQLITWGKYVVRDPKPPYFQIKESELVKMVNDYCKFNKPTLIY